MTSQTVGASALAHYLRVLRRGVWVALLCVGLGATSAVLLSLQQQKLYRASADVFLDTQDIAVALSNVQLPYIDPERAIATQADLARTPAVAEQAVRLARVRGRTADELIGNSTVDTTANADLLSFSVTDPDRRVAAALATAYAKAYTNYRRLLDTKSLVRARRDIEQRIDELKAEGQRRSALYVSLVQTNQRLRTLELLRGSNAALIRTAKSAAQIQPKPQRNGILGGVLGLVLGIGLAFLLDALNTRVRSTAEIEERLDLPLLARIPEPPRRLRAKNRLLMLADPRAREAESYQILATNLDFVNFDREARSIIVTSANREEGKSTTIANLAVALARAGRRVALVDGDLRQPSQHRYFELDNAVGLTSVVVGRAALDEALVPVPIVDGDERHAARNGGTAGLLQVLPGGPLAPNPAELARSHALKEVLAELEERFDVVLVDAPPLLGLSDAVSLSAKVDALLVVARVSQLRRPSLNELHRVLESAPVVKLGFVITGAPVEPGYGYGYQYGKRAAAELEKEPVR